MLLFGDMVSETAAAILRLGGEQIWGKATKLGMEEQKDGKPVGVQWHPEAPTLTNFRASNILTFWHLVMEGNTFPCYICQIKSGFQLPVVKSIPTNS